MGKWIASKVVSLAKDYITVDIDSNIFDVEKAAWEIINYKYDSNTKKIIKEVKGTSTISNAPGYQQFTNLKV